MSETTALRRLLTMPDTGTTTGRLFEPEDSGYAEACRAWNLATDLQPALVAVVESAEDVVACVRAARETGHRVAVQTTGHGATWLDGRDLRRTLLINLINLSGVVVDPKRRTARVLGGTTWDVVVAAAAEHGLAALHGSSGSVGVAGFALGGGLSFLARRYGLASSSVRSVELVTADGKLVHVSPTSHADLFETLGGRGAGIGIVVSLEIDLYPHPTSYAGMLIWPVTEAPRVLRAWRDWCLDAPETATTSLRVMNFPPLPELPPFLAGRSVVVIDGAVTGDDDPSSVLAPLRALGPEVDTFGEMPIDGLVQIHMDPPGPVPATTAHAVLGELTDKASDAFIGAAPGVFCCELRQLGGALGTDNSGLTGHFALLVLDVPPPGADLARHSAAVRDVVADLLPWALDEFVATFSKGRLSAGARTKFATVRAVWDAEGVFESPA